MAAARDGRLSIDQVRSGIARSIAKGDCYVVLDGQDLIGTITIDSFADPEFWADADDPGNAFYVHRMIVRRSHAGHNIGAELLNWASAQAKRAGRRWIRLDAWRTNLALHEYYKSQGFEQVRTVELPHRGSGALFQKTV